VAPDKVWRANIARISVGSISSHHGLGKNWSNEREVGPEKALGWGEVCVRSSKHIQE
jgi:hypothetical protein